MNTSLEQLHAALLERGHEDLLFHVTQAIQQRDRLLYGCNTYAASTDSMKNELLLLKERYRLLDQKHSQLIAINRQHTEELRAKNGNT